MQMTEGEERVKEREKGNRKRKQKSMRMRIGEGGMLLSLKSSIRPHYM